MWYRMLNQPHAGSAPAKSCRVGLLLLGDNLVIIYIDATP
jgi:hypothetical protein